MKKHVKNFFTLLLTILGLLVFSNESQCLTVTAAEDDYYTELYRPQYHFSTPEGRLADPNGLIYFNGEYHLFHQKMGTWAHAVSTDLLHWEHLPIALEHDQWGQAMSGTAVIDWHDTSGLFDGEAGMVAIYTNTEGGEAQSIAYSKDNGRNWKRYEGNPVVDNPGIKDFRDPKVFWHEETEQWIMLVSTDKTVTFYNSPNLIDWEYQSVFGIEEDKTEHGSHIAVWETPDLFPLAVDGDENNQKWVLTLSIGDNPVTDGSTNQYFIGEFDGSHFINDNDPDEVLYTDYGKDFYAGQSFNEVEEAQGRRIWLGWMANWRYPYQSPTSPWMGSMSIPRELTLRTNSDGNIRLFQEPIEELTSIQATKHKIDPFTLSGNREITDFTGISYEFELVASWDDLDEFGIRLRQSDEEETVVGIDVNSNSIYLDRSKAGLDQLTDRNGEAHQFGKKFDEDFDSDKQEVKIRGLVDESSIEIFINDGETVFTNLIYSQPTSNGIELFADGGELNIKSLEFNHLHSVWRPKVANGELERIVVNQETVNLSVDESTELIANAKPDWFSTSESFNWNIENPEIIQVEEKDFNKLSVHALKPGQTTVEISHPSGDKKKLIDVTVWDEEHVGYIDGWGPSPFHETMSGNWDIIDEANVNSHLGNGQTWTNIYRKEIITGDFTISANIKWVDQGAEGFPKYGLNIADQEGSLISGFYNNDINQLETNAEYKGHDIGWESKDLPTDTHLMEPQKLTIKREGNNFLFYHNDNLILERSIDIKDEVSIGIINENTQAEFSEFVVTQENVDEDNKDNSENSGGTGDSDDSNDSDEGDDIEEPVETDESEDLENSDEDSLTNLDDEVLENEEVKDGSLPKTGESNRMLVGGLTLIVAGVLISGLVKLKRKQGNN